MAMGTVRAGLLAIAAVLSSTPTASAADPTGQWATERDEARVRIAPCGGGALCGSIVALREPIDPLTRRPKTDEYNRDPRLRDRPLIGLRIVLGMRPGPQPGEWVGQVYNPDDGGHYPAKMTMRNDRTLRLEGCLAPNTLCSGQTWVRTR